MSGLHGRGLHISGLDHPGLDTEHESVKSALCGCSNEFIAAYADPKQLSLAGVRTHDLHKAEMRYKVLGRCCSQRRKKVKRCNVEIRKKRPITLCNCFQNVSFEYFLSTNVDEKEML